ncbi:MAG: helix-turn-helix domain-containing protein [Candidatus Omnitrophica bacterium]|nr:helix-turn-helix domain-containing protein [Candidatus Omnitrophota bacterium]
MKEKPIMNLKEVAQYLGLSQMSIYRYIKQGKIPASRVGGVWRFRKEKLIAWLERQEKER